MYTVLYILVHTHFHPLSLWLGVGHPGQDLDLTPEVQMIWEEITHQEMGNIGEMREVGEHNEALFEID